MALLTDPPLRPLSFGLVARTLREHAAYRLVTEALLTLLTALALTRRVAVMLGAGLEADALVLPVIARPAVPRIAVTDDLALMPTHATGWLIRAQRDRQLP